ncbi:MAG TPA: lipopolysaccharide assembly protein LapA domain-containing protein [Methylomirabilota bacterium]|nr:lipopolysaccharide assembly protein LapA domain-containing protein [Methylomirabilota bacterium]
MSVRIGVLLALGFGAAVAYLASLNTARVSIAVAADWAWEVPLAALVVGAFLAGAVLALLLGFVRDLGRSYRDYQRAREARRAESLGDVYHRGVDAQLSGRADAALQIYEELLTRDPGHAQAHARLGELALERGDAHGALVHHLDALRGEERPELVLAAAEDFRRTGRPGEAAALLERLLVRDHDHVAALRALRDLAVAEGRWQQALGAQERFVALGPGERRPEQAMLAGIQYELGRALLAGGQVQAAIARFRDALRSQSDFVPAIISLGDAHRAAGDSREALRVWERAVEIHPELPLLARLEQAYRVEGRPTRMIALYQAASARAPESVPLAFALGRVYFELAMLDEAADQFQKVEVREPNLPGLHAVLGAIFERRGQTAEAFEEYRRALTLSGAFDWPYRCSACGAEHGRWIDRCPSCRGWNTSRP